ncbi:MAG: DUF4296 domain-containing protein [Bacteroidales bacterium]|nr:DUF4296 domain-containing protein [Bacteroidales bacterium]
MNKVIFLFLGVIFFISCGRDNVEYKVMPLSDIEKIMYQIHLHDALKEVHSSTIPEATFYDSTYYSDSILSKFEIDKNTFMWNVIYYSQLDKMDKVYLRIIDSLEKGKSNVEKLKFLETNNNK